MLKGVYPICADVESVLQRYLDDVDRDMIERAFYNRVGPPDDQRVVAEAVKTHNNTCFWWYYTHFHTELVSSVWAEMAAVSGNLAILKRLKPYDSRKICKLAIQHKQLHVFKHFLPKVRPLRAGEWLGRCHKLPRFKHYIENIVP